MGSSWRSYALPWLERRLFRNYFGIFLIYNDTDFRFFAGSTTAIGQHWCRLPECLVERSHLRSWRCHTAAICHPACRPVDHPSRPCTSPYRPPRSPHTTCCPSSYDKPAYKPWLKRSAPPPVVGLSCIPCLQTSSHSCASRVKCTLYFFAKSVQILTHFILRTHSTFISRMNLVIPFRI